ncbi:MAG: Lrp/AsnC family transcriptional regulator [Candidatus Nanoarchaeia archaeon]
MKLDKVDLKILKRVDLDPRITSTKLGKQCLISQQVADYRLKSLTEKKAIHGFYTIINFFSLGYSPYLLLLKTNPLSVEQKKQIKQHILSANHIHIARSTGGEYDYSLFILAKTYAELDHHLNSLFEKIDFIKDYEIYPITEINHYKNKHLNIHELHKITISEAPELAKIDPTDQNILQQVSNNCRKSNMEIGKELNLNYNTIKNRIDTLEDKKIILGHLTYINSEAINLEYFNLLISFKNYSKAEENQFISFCNSSKDITHSTSLLGGVWSFKLGIQTKNLETLQETTRVLRSTFPNIDEISIIPIFEEIKRNTFPI